MILRGHYQAVVYPLVNIGRWCPLSEVAYETHLLISFFLDEAKEFIRFRVDFCLKMARRSSFHAKNYDEQRYSKITIERKEVSDFKEKKLLLFLRLFHVLILQFYIWHAELVFTHPSLILPKEVKPQHKIPKTGKFRNTEKFAGEHNRHLSIYFVGLIVLPGKIVSQYDLFE